MGELSRLLEKDRGAFSTLNLRYVYIDKDRPLAQIVPTKRSPTIYLFRHGIPYLYGGRLTGSHILEGTKHGMRTKGFPLELLQTTEALKSFVDSTDRAFLLLDFCGFAQTIVQKHLQSKGLLVGANTMALENEGVDHATSDRQHDERSDAVEGVGGNGNLPEVSFQYHEPLLEKLFEGLENSSRDTSMELTMRSRSWDEHFISSILPGVANSTSGPTANVGHESSSFSEDDGSMCTTLEKERFDAVFDNFSKVAIRNALTPHRAKFGIVTIESVAVDVGLVELGSRPWKLVAKAQDPHRVPDEFDIEKGVESFVSSVSPTLVKEVSTSKPPGWVYNRGDLWWRVHSFHCSSGRNCVLQLHTARGIMTRTVVLSYILGCFLRCYLRNFHHSRPFKLEMTLMLTLLAEKVWSCSLKSLLAFLPCIHAFLQIENAWAELPATAGTGGVSTACVCFFCLSK